MRLLLGALLLGWLCGAFAAEESCVGRCDKGFDDQKKCQCDDLCSYYQSCCDDYFTACKPKVTRGDVFFKPEDEYLDYYDVDLTNATATVPTDPFSEPVSGDPQEFWPTEETTVPFEATVPSETTVPFEATVPFEPTLSPEPETATTESEEFLCSRKPFDAFMTVKNGSIYTFRGKYFYELDEKSARLGYPKLIREVWGIEGPIDAAFTRINCQGKSYIFKGSQYWRFEDGVLEPDFPRNISYGFKGIPDHIDAAFALPAQNYLASERVYFFKGKRYWSYDFDKQPSRENCEETTPSLVFDHFALLLEDSWEEIFMELFGGSRRSGASRPRYISQDWRGVPSQLDAAMVGRIYVAHSPSKRRRSRKKSSRRHRKRYRSRRRWGNWKSSAWDWPEDTSSESMDLDWLLSSPTSCQPYQSVYFFVGDKYYRLNLRTRRVDFVYPKYPRSIAKYWLGCPSNAGLA
ncbi:vitronectin [Heteronotia binoei]|uniref:vitronectin n=1 Tax=Heteronotia binoei TaxID=13085 RepID=UPI00292E9898|nr:vitronectin [Heteronotia binoei]